MVSVTELTGMTNEKANLTLVSMITPSKFSNFSDELTKNDELSEYKLSGSNCLPNQRKLSK